MNKLVIIAVSSVLTLALLVFFVVAGWKVFIGGDVDVNNNGVVVINSGSHEFVDTTYSNDGLFGFILGADPKDHDKNMEAAAEIGTDWVRLAGPVGLIWGRVEKEKGLYDWTEFDGFVKSAYDNGLNIFCTVLVSNKIYGVSHGYYPEDIEAYKNFIQAVAERYDGDGIDDAGGSPVVKVWQISNEIDLDGWEEDFNKYAKLMAVSYDVIKSADHNTRVAIAGISGPPGLADYIEVLSYMKDRIYFDIFDIHWHAIDGGNYLEQPKRGESVDNFLDYLSTTRRILDESNHGDSDVWITEMSISDSVPDTMTEKKQAVDLIKRYIYPASKNVKVVFWGGIFDQAWMGGTTSIFANNSLVDLDGNIKLSYYAYKLMYEKLNGFSAIKTIEEFDDIHVYKIMKGNNPIWVAWSDTGSGSISLSLLGISSAKITEAIPDADSGAELNENDYPSFFDTYTATEKINLGEYPVYIEEK